MFAERGSEQVFPSPHSSWFPFFLLCYSTASPCFFSLPTGVTCKRSSCSLEGRRGGHLLELSKTRQIGGVNKGERLLVFGLIGFVLTREPRESGGQWPLGRRTRRKRESEKSAWGWEEIELILSLVGKRGWEATAEDFVRHGRRRRTRSLDFLQWQQDRMRYHGRVSSHSSSKWCCVLDCPHQSLCISVLFLTQTGQSGNYFFPQQVQYCLISCRGAALVAESFASIEWWGKPYKEDNSNGVTTAGLVMQPGAKTHCY